MRWLRPSLGLGAAVLMAAVLCGCTTPAIDSARQYIYRPDLMGHNHPLEQVQVPSKDAVLFLMERGTVYQQSGDYERSSRDFIAASDAITQAETISLSKGAGSFVINDTVTTYRGFPFERNLLHAMTAMNHFAIGNFDNAGVEARRLIERMNPEMMKTFPDDAFARYVAAFALEMQGDTSNAELMYKKAADVGGVSIDPAGHFLGLENEAARTSKGWKNELVVFVLLGNSNRPELSYGQTSPSLYAEVYAGETYLGRSAKLTDTRKLLKETEKVVALKKTAKTVARVALKEVAAQAIESETDSEAAGALARLILIGLLERPDNRNWATLPRWLHVVRVPCPPDPSQCRLLIKKGSGELVNSSFLTRPMGKRGNTFVTFARDALYY